jgi:hypothetical protein
LEAHPNFKQRPDQRAQGDLRLHLVAAGPGPTAQGSDWCGWGAPCSRSSRRQQPQQVRAMKELAAAVGATRMMKCVAA